MSPQSIDGAEPTTQERIDALHAKFTPPASTRYPNPRSYAEATLTTITPQEGEVRLILQLMCPLNGHRENRTLYLDDLLRLREDVDAALARANPEVWR